MTSAAATTQQQQPTTTNSNQLQTNNYNNKQQPNNQQTTTMQPSHLLAFALCCITSRSTLAWVPPLHPSPPSRATITTPPPRPTLSTHRRHYPLHMSSKTTEKASPPMDYEIPEDAVISIKPNAMKRLRELRKQQGLAEDEPLVLRMGVRSGGCSGMSYVMDIAKEGDTPSEDDAVDEYPGVQCVVDAKSMLYLYGLELDYSDELVGGGFKFINPNAEESCGCGSSFGV